MSFDPTQPTSGSPQTSVSIRDNFNVLGAFVDTALATGQMQIAINR